MTKSLEGACGFLRRKFTRLYFPLVLLALIGLSDFYFQKVTRTHHSIDLATALSVFMRYAWPLLNQSFREICN